ncbi:MULTISPECIES: disulfide bond formation protein B [Halorubrum]|uniref:Disulfide bond formation protein DsbB n=1 Tax=Halorubrum hochstenium ATCC 700873 TaxID=1227481 RepID=M0FKD8_9EURY|nr:MULTISPECIES: disulfide bond formation protein B [Halorubrum]ELZ59793.1 disulfide bond formation protein DsbB [Halorubrum hochstenium ATCC 700873]
MTGGRSAATAWLSAATAVATLATAGSLWFSLGLGLTPCDLCWYQRIAMYPLVVVLGVAAVEERPAVARTALPLVAVGLGLAVYHSYLQATLAECTVGGPCATVLWRSPLVGLSIPNLSLVAFGVLAVLLVGMRRRV